MVLVLRFCEIFCAKVSNSQSIEWLNRLVVGVLPISGKKLKRKLVIYFGNKVAALRGAVQHNFLSTAKIKLIQHSVNSCLLWRKWIDPSAKGALLTFGEVGLNQVFYVHLSQGHVMQNISASAKKV